MNLSPDNLKSFTLNRLSFGPLYPAGDVDFPVCAEREQRIDHNRDVPSLCKACGIKQGDVVIDVGGFVGDTAYAFAKAGAKVVVYEPFLDSFVCLCYNTRGLAVTGINAPAGNGEWVEYIYDCPGPNYGMRRMRQCSPNTPGAVQTVKLDDLPGLFSTSPGVQLVDQVKLIKIDCEGFEIPTMLGARELIKRARPFLYVEHYVDGQKNCGFTPQQLVSTIQDLGYDLEMVGSPPRWDWFCVPIPGNAAVWEPGHKAP